MKRTTWSAALAAAAVLTVALSGCAGESGPAAGPGDASGDSVKVMVFGSFPQPPFPLSQIKTAAEAAVGRVNGDGGVAGQQIDLIACDDQMSANGAAACGRQAVQEGVIAVVGAFTLFGDSIVPQLATAGIPYLGNVAISAEESTNDVSFPVMTAGAPNLAAVVSLKEQGCEAAVITAVDTAASQGAYTDFGEPVGEQLGVEMTFVPYPANTTDFTSVAARIADASNCVIYGGGAQDSAAIINALAQTGDHFINVALSTIAFPESSLAQLGDGAEGVQVLSPFDFPSTKTEGITQAIADMKAKDDKVTIDETAINSYNAVLMLKAAGEKVSGDLTAASLLETLQAKGTTLDTGLTAPVDFATDSGFFPPIPRAAGSVYQPYVAKDGVFVPNGDKLDLSGLF